MNNIVTAVHTNGNHTPAEVFKQNGDHGDGMPPIIADLVAQSTIKPIETDQAELVKNFKFKPMSMREMLALPPKQWIIDQVLGAGDIAMVYGAPGSGKTFVEVDMIFAACLGRPWAMRFAIPKPLSVAYCAGEGVSGLPQRFGAAAEHWGVDDLPNFTFYAITPSLFYEDRLKNETESIERFMLEWKMRQDAGEAQPLDILVIDTLHSATAGADENSARDMGVVVDLCRKAARVLGCAVVLVHHSNKAGTGERGSSALRGAMDCMIEVKTVSSKFLMVCDKLKDGQKWKEQTFDLIAKGDSVRVWWDEPNTETDESRAPSPKLLALMKEHIGTKFTAKQLAEPIGMSQSAVINILNRLLDRGEIERELYEVEKPPSNRNPWVYFLKSLS